MKTIFGDLTKLALNGTFDVIVHGCNCFNTMGAGVAKAIRTKFPQAYAADIATTRGDRFKLGNYSQSEACVNGRKLTIVNAYTQFDYGGSKRNVDYDALRSVFRQIKADFPAPHRLPHDRSGSRRRRLEDDLADNRRRTCWRRPLRRRLSVPKLTFP